PAFAPSEVLSHEIAPFRSAVTVSAPAPELEPLSLDVPVPPLPLLPPLSSPPQPTATSAPAVSMSARSQVMRRMKLSLQSSGQFRREDVAQDQPAVGLVLA